MTGETSLKECDMVYPKAIPELSQQYRFRSIGGTSAGATAAVVTAAAEYNRGSGVRTILVELKTLDFGFCRGAPQSDGGAPGLSDWLAVKIEIAAGRMRDGDRRRRKPLTFGDIWRGRDDGGSPEKPVIDLRMMTTNLTVRRPHALPHMDRNHGLCHRAGECRQRLAGPVAVHAARLPRAHRDGLPEARGRRHQSHHEPEQIDRLGKLGERGAALMVNGGSG